MLRFHVVGLPHAKTTKDFETCAFTEKVRKFCKMMKMEGHWVHLCSAGDANEAPCDVWTSCLPEDERIACLEGKHFTQASFDRTKVHWCRFNDNVIRAIASNLTPWDFICIIGGTCHKPIADHYPELITVEFGIGYPGTWAPFRVWESYAWMHTCYGTTKTNAGDLDGVWYDAVIPSYFEPELFPIRRQRDLSPPYYLYIGRLTDRKGWRIAQEVCERLGKKLIVAGPGEFSGYGEYVGVVGAKERARLMGGATAQFTPTIYIEPFGSVVCEAQMCGTPVITTDWGAFTETVIQGVTGYRCRYLGEFMDAALKAGNLDRQLIHDHAVKEWSLKAVAPRYTEYFHRINTLTKDGWYTTNR